MLPIRHRRLILTLRFFKRLLLDHTTSIAAAAFRDACALYMSGGRGWIGDLAHALASLPHPVPVDFIRVTTAPDVDAIIRLVEDSVRAEVRTFSLSTVDKCPNGLAQARSLMQFKRHLHLLRDRVDVDGRNKPCDDPVRFRTYLNIPMPHHRKALTLIMTGEHSLLDVRGGWSVRGLKIARPWRRCRFCETDIEDSTHALFLCNVRADLTALRLRFWDDIADTDPAIWGCSQDPARWIHALCNHPIMSARLGKFAFDILQLFNAHRPFQPPASAWITASTSSDDLDEQHVGTWDTDSRLSAETRTQPIDGGGVAAMVIS